MKPSPHRFVIEALLFLTYACFGVSWLAVAPIAPDLMRAFRVTVTEFSTLGLVVTIAKVIAPITTGTLALRLGLARTFLLGSVLVCAVLAGPFAPSFAGMVASRFLFGLGGAVVVTVMGPIAMAWFPREELPAVNAWNGVAVNTGIALTMYLTPPLAGALGWRGALLVYGAVNLALMVAWVVFGRDHAAAGGPAQTLATSEVGYLDVWRRKETWLVSLAFTGAVALYLSFSYWLPTFYQAERSFPPAMAAQVSGVVNLAGIPSAIVCGSLTRRLGLRRPFLISGGLLTGVAAFGVFLPASAPAILASAVVLGVALFIPTASYATLLMELPGVTPRHVSLMMGTMFSFCYVISAFAPTLVGALRDRTGTFVPGFVALTVFSWVIFLSGILLPETGPAARKAPLAA